MGPNRLDRRVGKEDVFRGPASWFLVGQLCPLHVRISSTSLWEGSDSPSITSVITGGQGPITPKPFMCRARRHMQGLLTNATENASTQYGSVCSSLHYCGKVPFMKSFEAQSMKVSVILLFVFVGLVTLSARGQDAGASGVSHARLWCLPNCKCSCSRSTTL